MHKQKNNHSSSIKRNKSLILPTIWMNSEKIMLVREARQKRFSMIPLIWNSRKGGQRWNKGWTAKEHKKTLRDNGDVLILIMVVVSWVITSIKTHCGMMAAKWPNRTYLTHNPPSTTTIWHSPMDKSTFMEAMESSTIHQGTPEETGLTMRHVIGIQTSVLAVGPTNGPYVSSPFQLQSSSPWRTMS